MAHEHKMPIEWGWMEGVQVADLPYGGEAFSMTILLPDNASEINALVELLTQYKWNDWTGALDTNEVYVSLPKFTLEYEIGLNEVLQSLGMAIAFSPGEADFTRMYAPGGIWIDSVTHKAYVDVNEEGTEAAAATAVSMELSAIPFVIANRPFLFVIRERFSGTILFMGKVMDPTAG